MIPNDCELAVIELGANHIGEIEELCNIADPDYGLITNAGKDHLEGFGTVEGVRIALNELNDHLRKKKGVAFVNAYLQDMLDLAKGLEIHAFGPEGTETEVSLHENNKTISVAWKYRGEPQEVVQTKLAGAYNLHNIACAMSIGLHFKISPQQIKAAIENYTPGNNRSQWVNTGKNEVILDAYNANPSSMEEALRNLAAQKDCQPYFMIGDMLEMGDAEEKEHIAILDLCEKLGLQGCVVGKAFNKASSKFQVRAFENVADAKAHFRASPLVSKLILLKGSRGIKMEEMLEVV
jgi:UDP-N-acetylmuramoyl-tripeptide--D-alanyl-D-alanine ligase